MFSSIMNHHRTMFLSVIFFLDAFIKNQTILITIIVTGTNGDREMIASLLMANFDVFDVTMSDLQNKKITLDAFQGLVFPGGFSYAGKFLHN